MMGLLRLSFLLGVFCIFSVVGFGVDPTLRINVFDEMKLGKSFSGVSQVPGFHNESRAFLFQDTGRSVRAPADVVERMVRRLRNRSEFTVLATLKQEELNSGVILSIHNAKQRFLELESSGQRNEIRLHYHTRNQKPHSEVFPYTLADNQWHKVSIAVSASHVLLHVDCNRIYERVVEPPVMDIPRDTSFWLGQRNKAHGFFKMEKCDRKSDRIKKSVRYFESDDSGSDQESDNATDLDSDDSVTEAAYEDGLDPQLDFEDTEDPPPPGSEGSGTSQPATPVKRRRPSSSFSPSPSKGRAPPAQRRKGSTPATPDEGRWNFITDPDVEPQVFRFCPTRRPGVQLDTSKSYSPLELFQLFFDQSVVRTLCANTNKNAERLSAQGRKCPWVPLTVNECYHFLGMVIFMGLLKVFTLADYWGLHRLYAIPFCRSVMARKRFEAIVWTFHMSDPEEDEENKRKRGTPEYDRLFSLKPLLDSVVLSCKAFYHPRQNLSIDERMVRSRARIMLKQHMKTKPIKWGFKLFVLADSRNGYTCNFTIYQGRSGPASGKGLSYTSVMNLIDVPQLGTGYRLYVDNFYTSTALFRDLYGLKFGACGTIRENRLGFPRTKVNGLTRKSKRGEIRWIRDKELLFVKWKDTREVAMCTSIHTVYTGDEAQRRLVTPDGKWTTYSIPVPTAVRAYNRYMGGVDLSDALIKYYNVGHKTKKWYKTLFYHFVDIAAVNAFLLQKDMAEIQNTRPLTQKMFREKLCQQLVDVGEESPAPAEEPEQPQPAKPKPKVVKTEKTEKKKACVPVCITEGLAIDCSQKATKGRKYCVLCSEERNGLKTIWKCEACEGKLQDVQLVVMPQGYISQCPDLNRTCPTCNDFHGLIQKIMELQDILAKTSSKLSRAEEKMVGLDRCYCERTCSVNGVVYREEESWADGCRRCSCVNGTVQCEPVSCPPLQCPPDSAPGYVSGECCKECRRVCLFRGSVYVEGVRRAERDSTGRCLLFECKDRKMLQVEDPPHCPPLGCPESEQITLPDRCCKVCRGHDFCSEGHNCVEHSDCVNLEAGSRCVCQDGYHALRDDGAFCDDVDECAGGRQYCRENTVCVNTPGSFLCVCRRGYVRIDDYCCAEHDECASGQHSCDPNALCFNTVGGHSCSCKPGYSGNGTHCKASCDGLCQNGGTCASPDTCICQQGFTGEICETDIDECADGFVECDSRATCINLPGWYHCECRDGYHDNGLFSPKGESCEDIDECRTGRNSCANDTVCFNLEGGYDCRCPHGKNCTGDCIHDNRVKHHGQIWVLENDRCSVCSCQSGLVMCRRMVCDCENPTLDLYCCPECDPRLSSQCLHQNGLRAYGSGDTWVENCQQCQCLQGEVDCWPLPCPPGDCDFTVVPEGECCPRCVTDPCQADTIRNDITKTCADEQGVARFSGSSWIKRGTECTRCQCKNGHVCCSVDPMCL